MTARERRALEAGPKTYRHSMDDAPWVTHIECCAEGCRRRATRFCRTCGMARCGHHAVAFRRFADCASAGSWAMARAVQAGKKGKGR